MTDLAAQDRERTRVLFSFRNSAVLRVPNVIRRRVTASVAQLVYPRGWTVFGKGFRNQQTRPVGQHLSPPHPRNR